METTRRPREIAVAAAVVLCAVVLVAVPELPPLCPVRLLAGVPCPSCGLTRATRLLVTGHVEEGLHMHVLAPVVLAYVAWFSALEVRGLTRRERPFASLEGSRARAALVVLLALLLVVWLARFAGLFGGPAPV